MSAGNFEPCLDVTLVHEGGYSNNPADPGGSTMRGVTQATYDAYCDSIGKPRTSVRYITDGELKAIYRRDYWDKVNGDRLDKGVDLATFDAAVNSGPARARKWLLASVGGSAVETIQRLCAARLSFMQGLAIWKTFGKGWQRRVADIEARAVKMAVGQVAQPVLVQKKAKAEKAVIKAKKSSQVSTGTGAAGGVAAGTSGSDLWLYVLIAIVIAAGIAALIYWRRASYEEARAEAFGKVALEG